VVPETKVIGGGSREEGFPLRAKKTNLGDPLPLTTQQPVVTKSRPRVVGRKFMVGTWCKVNHRQKFRNTIGRKVDPVAFCIPPQRHESLVKRPSNTVKRSKEIQLVGWAPSIKDG